MRALIAAAVAGTVLALPAAVGARNAQPGDAFFVAIKNGEYDTAAAMVRGKIKVVEWQQKRLGIDALTPQQLFERVRGCAFDPGIRKEYEPIRAIAWTCPLQPTAANPRTSRTLLVEAKFQGSRVMLDRYSETDGNRRVPPAGG